MPGLDSGGTEVAVAFTASRGETRDATEEEIKNLQHVVDDKLPRTVWIALVISAVERFTFWAVTTPWRKNSKTPFRYPQLTTSQKTTCRIAQAAAMLEGLWAWDSQLLQTSTTHSPSFIA